MFKNHVVAFVIATFVAIIIQFGQTEAADYYMGKYPDGSEAYLCSDKIVEISIHNDSYDTIYDIAVKKVVNGVLVDIDIYSVIYGQSYLITKNGRSLFSLRTAQNYLSTHEVEPNIMNYIYKNWYTQNRFYKRSEDMYGIVKQYFNLQ